MGLLTWAIIFLVVALLAALLGFGKVANLSFDIAKLLFFVFLVIFVVLLVLSFSR